MLNTSVLSVGAGDSDRVVGAVEVWEVVVVVVEMGDGVPFAAEEDVKCTVIRAGSSGFSERETVMGIAGL
jgi:hypothetical protein